MSDLIRGKHKFRIGQRVRPSLYGKQSCIFPKTRHDQSGVVLKVDKFNSPTVMWQGRKTPKSYYSGFIEPDHRRRAAPPRSRMGGAEKQDLVHERVSPAVTPIGQEKE